MPAESDAEFAEYVGGRLPSLRRLALLLCHDWHRADDLVQVSITKLYVHWHRARMAALDLDPEPTVEPAPVEAAVDEVERRVSCVTNTILRHIEGLSRGETERLLAALRSRIDEIERDVAEVVSLAEAALSDRAAIPADLSIPDCLKRTEAAA